MLPRLVATDLDGTLLHTDGSVTPRTRGVLTALEQRGVTVVFVTGRPLRWMDHLWEHVGPHGLAVCSNGGLVYDVPSRSVRTARTIPVAVGLEAGRALRAAVPGTAYAVERVGGFAKEPGFLPSHPPPADLHEGPLEEILDPTVVKILARHESLGPEEFWARVEDAVGRRVTTTWSSTGALVELSAAGVTKATTLELVCADLGVDAAEVVAFGDMPNDVPMLSWAGTSYAMAGAHRSVRDVADLVAPANDEDGVEAVLEELFGLGTPAEAVRSGRRVGRGG